MLSILSGPDQPCQSLTPLSPVVAFCDPLPTTLKPVKNAQNRSKSLKNRQKSPKIAKICSLASTKRYLE
jgi:hypothetical protein